MEVFDNGTNKGIVWGLYEELHPREEADQSSVEAFWEMILGENGDCLIDTHAFALGFIEAALEIWKQVKGKL